MVTASPVWDVAAGELGLTLTQTQAALDGHPQPEPLPIPVRLGLIGEQGALRVSLQGELGDDFLLMLDQPSQTWVFSGVSEAPVLSLFRDFSAPVRVDYACDDAALARLVRADSNGFNRWAAAQELATREIVALAELIRRGDVRARAGRPSVLADALTAMWPALAVSDPALAVKLLELPSLGYLAEQVAVYDPAALHAAREQVLLAICAPLAPALRGILAREVMLQAYVYNADAIAGRSLARTALDALARIAPDEAAGVATELPRARAEGGTAGPEDGSCQPIPESCIDEVKSLVCGCDGVEYDSPCHAAMAQVHRKAFRCQREQRQEEKNPRAPRRARVHWAGGGSAGGECLGG